MAEAVSDTYEHGPCEHNSQLRAYRSKGNGDLYAVNDPPHITSVVLASFSVVKAECHILISNTTYQHSIHLSFFLSHLREGGSLAHGLVESTAGKIGEMLSYK